MKRTGLASALLLALGLALSGCWLAPPVARFTVSPTSGTSPLLVDCDAAASTSGGSEIAEYFWSFGDGTTGQGRNISHVYETDEHTTFTIILTVTDHEGRQTSATGAVRVSPRPATPPDGPDDEPQALVKFIWPFNYDASGEDAENLNDEYFTLRNLGVRVVDMSGWTVESGGGHTYQFPDGFVLAVGSHVFVHTGSGPDTATDLYMNASAPVWQNGSDLAFLRDASGTIIDIYTYTSCRSLPRRTCV